MESKNCGALRLIRPDLRYAGQVMAYKAEMLENGDSFDGCAGLETCETYAEWLDFTHRLQQTYIDDYVPSEVFLTVREADDVLVGIMDYRHPLSGFLAKYGGNIGYSVRPSQRRKGYATQMLSLLLPICRDHGEKRVLLTCDKGNAASEKVIRANGGVLESEIPDPVGLGSSGVIQRYWIELPALCAAPSDEKMRACAALAYEKYRAETAFHDFLTGMERAAFDAYFQSVYEDAACVSIEHDGKTQGFLLYSTEETDEEIRVYIPVCGYSARDEKSMSRLFSLLAEGLVKEKPVHFSVQLYAHDVAIQRLFDYLSFGFMSEKTVRKIEPIPDAAKDVKIDVLEKDELAARWNEVWALLSALIDTLRVSPVFYPGREFTQELYRDFFSDDSVTVYAAQDGGRIIGLIECNTEGYGFAFGESASANVGEAYVLPEYRGRGVAQALLQAAEADLAAKGIAYDWVEHGTANPTARGFWNKFFKTFAYELVRDIGGEASDAKRTDV